MKDRSQLAFVVSSLILMAVVGAAGLKNHYREHRQVQRAFQHLTSGRAPELAADPDRRGIVQIWLPAFNRAERCVSCHLGVDSPLLHNAPLPFRSHSAVAHAPSDFKRFGCVSCHGGQGAATTREEAHGRTAHWHSPLLDASSIEGRCGRCHSGDAVPEAPRLSRGRTLITRLGCFNCHFGGRDATAADAPPLEGLSVKVSRAWLRRLLKDPKDVNRNARMPNFHLTADEIEALTEYLFSLTSPPAVREPIRLAALESDGDAEAGALVFRRARCISCHTLEGKGHGSAPELSQIGSKASKAWLLAFMKGTHAFNPKTLMPAFELSSAELRNIVAYMAHELRDFDAPEAPGIHDAPARDELAQEGRTVFVKYACAACHNAAKPGHEDFGPDLSGIGDARAASVDFGSRKDLPRTLRAWLNAKVIEPRSFGPGLKMPSFALSEDQVGDIVTAMLSLSKEQVPDEFMHSPSATLAPTMRPPSGEMGSLFARYRCLACHRIGNAGTDLSTAPLTFQGSKTKRDWLARYLVLPETIYPLLTERMPVLGITPAEANAIANYISTVYVDDAIEARTAVNVDSPTAVANGARLFIDKGCGTCHIVGKTGGYVGPPLTEAGDRFRSAWIGYWLQNPQRWRRDARCPNFGLTDAEIADLTAFLSAQRGERK